MLTPYCAAAAAHPSEATAMLLHAECGMRAMLCYAMPQLRSWKGCLVFWHTCYTLTQWGGAAAQCAQHGPGLAIAETRLTTQDCQHSMGHHSCICIYCNSQKRKPRQLRCMLHAAAGFLYLDTPYTHSMRSCCCEVRPTTATRCAPWRQQKPG